jgi:long-chain acyl-CoA synthetase
MSVNNQGAPVMTRTVAGALRPALATRSHAPAVTASSGTLTYLRLDEAADRAATAMWEAGVRPGDRVAACLPNDLDIVAAFHGTQRIGAIWVGISEQFSQTEQQALADLATPSLILAGPKAKLDDSTVASIDEWRRMTASAVAAPPRPAIDPHAPAAIAFTSGTTGTPKGIVHSQWNMVLPGQVLVRTRNWGPDLRKGDCLALTLLNMQVLTTLVTAQAGGCCLLTDRRDIAGICDWIAAGKVSVWNGVPAHFYDFLQQPALELGGLTEAWCGGSSCPEQLRQDFASLCAVPMCGTYGLTEAPTVVAIDPADGRSRPGTSGQVLPHLDVAAYDDDDSRLPAGEVGELRISPASSGRWAGLWRPMLGEWQDGAITPALDLPFPTGDMGSVDDDGWLRVVERKKLIILRGGANVYPAEVEGVIRQHPAVAAAAVFGVPDARLGEKVAALIQPRSALDLSDLEQLCLQRLARYKVPECWAEVDKLPANAMGKVIRSELPGLLDHARQIRDGRSPTLHHCND